MRKSYRRSISASILLTTLVISTGCSAVQKDQQSATTPPTASATATNEPTPSNSHIALGIVGIPVNINCNQLISASDLYQYNPNLAVITPTSSSSESMKLVEDANGNICAYENLSNGNVIQIGISKISEGSLPLATSFIESNNSSSALVPGTNTSVYFSPESSGGVARLLNGQYFIVISSPEFSNATDAIEMLLLFMNQLP